MLFLGDSYTWSHHGPTWMAGPRFWMTIFLCEQVVNSTSIILPESVPLLSISKEDPGCDCPVVAQLSFPWFVQSQLAHVTGHGWNR